MSRPNPWHRERLTKASIANRGDEPTTNNIASRSNSRNPTTDSSYMNSDEEDDDSSIDDELPGAYAITRDQATTESLQFTDEEENWDPTEPPISSFNEEDATPPPQQVQEGQREEAPTSNFVEIGTLHHHMYHLDAFTVPPPPRVHYDDGANRDGSKGSSCCSWRSNRPKRLCLSLFMLVAVCAGAGVAVAFFVTGDDENAYSSAGVDDNFSTGDITCDSVVDAASLDPCLQCKCFRRIEMKAGLQDAYDSLRISSLIADNLENSSLPVDSCEAENIALVSVATNIESRKDKGLDTSPEEILTNFALSVLYVALEGPGWTTHTRWLSDHSPCGWEGVSCNGDGNIVSLTMSDKNVGGTLDNRIGLLFALKTLDLSYNEIKGSIPFDIWKLPDLGKYPCERLMCC
jgi:hypothetical protein